MLRDFTRDKFDILIQAGQSNSEGAGFGPVEEPYRPDGRVWYLNQNGMLTLAAEEVWYNDARGASLGVHYRHLSGLPASVRATFDVPDLPFIAGDFVQDWKSANADSCAPVVEAIRAVCRDCGRGGFAESEGLLSNRQELDYPP